MDAAQVKQTNKLRRKMMDENCYVKPIYKNASIDQFQKAETATLAVWGMGCENCVTRVRNSLLELDAVYGVDVFLNMAIAEVRYDSKKVSADALVTAVSSAGNDGRHNYRAELIAAE
jgi:copper chaperone CopZ